MKTYIAALLLALAPLAGARERVNLNDADWRFSFGHTDPALDFGAGTEYFNYLTKANSIHNAGPYAREFADSAWARVRLPHDFVGMLPYDSVASHSHGYKTVGYRYPATSVGWYRTVVPIDSADADRRITLRFDGIFRDSRVFFNGFYLGGEPSGYAEQAYDVTPYVNFGGDNVIAVRADATFEEGWFYEGGGIYRDAWLEKSPAIHLDPRSIAVEWLPVAPSEGAGGRVKVTGRVVNDSSQGRDQGLTVRVELLDASGQLVGGDSASAISLPSDLEAKASAPWEVTLRPAEVELWRPDSPVLYNVRVTLQPGSDTSDVEEVTTGLRTIEWSPDNGMLLNGTPTKLLGADMHQDHAGVGVAIPDAVQIYRLKVLKELGMNTIRTSHNPASPSMLAAADSLGFFVVEENRLFGINDYHVGQLRKMIDRDRNHPSVILWSVGNEEWGVEWDKRGALITDELREICHRLDPTRLMTVATSSGPTVVETADVAGYNYIVQNPIERHRAQYPRRIAFGSEETTGAGTRGVYFDDRANGRMASLNRTPDTHNDSTLNRIARGWKFYRDRPWLAGLCYWTGFDYRGEPNPLSFPATGSEFGIVDYCGFPKDEAYYIKSQWTDEPVLHLLPHWNLEGHEGEMVDIWAYTNLDEVELTVNGRKMGRRKVNPGDYVAWQAPYAPGRIEAKGYRDGRQVAKTVVETAGTPVKAEAVEAYTKDGVTVVNVTLRDARGRFTPTASPMLRVTLAEGAELLGAGNGDPALRHPEQPSAFATPRNDTATLSPTLCTDGSTAYSFPAFNGHAQFIVRGPMPEITLEK